MIHGAHAIVYAANAEKARAFFRDVLGFRSVDAGDGWLIFALPPAELGVHPDMEGTDAGRHELYLMCDDVERTVAELRAKGVKFTSPVADHGWGLLTSLRIPGGGEIGLYEPRHPTAIAPSASKRARPRRGATKPAKKTSRTTAKKSRGPEARTATARAGRAAKRSGRR